MDKPEGERRTINNNPLLTGNHNHALGNTRKMQLCNPLNFYLHKISHEGIDALASLAFKKDVRFGEMMLLPFCIIAHQWSKQTRLSFFLPLFRNMRASVTNVMCTKTIHANTIADKQRFMLCFIKSIRCNVNKWTRGPFRQQPIQALFTHSDPHDYKALQSNSVA